MTTVLRENGEFLQPKEKEAEALLQRFAKLYERTIEDQRKFQQYLFGMNGEEADEGQVLQVSDYRRLGEEGEEVDEENRELEGHFPNGIKEADPESTYLDIEGADPIEPEEFDDVFSMHDEMLNVIDQIRSLAMEWEEIRKSLPIQSEIRRREEARALDKVVKRLK